MLCNYRRWLSVWPCGCVRTRSQELMDVYYWKSAIIGNEWESIMFNQLQNTKWLAFLLFSFQGLYQNPNHQTRHRILNMCISNSGNAAMNMRKTFQCITQGHDTTNSVNHSSKKINKVDQKSIRIRDKIFPKDTHSLSPLGPAISFMVWYYIQCRLLWQCIYWRKLLFQIIYQSWNILTLQEIMLCQSSVMLHFEWYSCR